MTVVLGALRQHKYNFIDVYKEEASTAVKAVVKQVFYSVEICSYSSVYSYQLLLN